MPRRRLLLAVVALAALLPLGGSAQAAEHRIIGGTESPAGSWPFAVYLSGTFYSCGGSLIAPDWVLTAAHCILPGIPGVPASPAAHITATAGTTDINSGGQSSIGLRALVHPNYLAVGSAYDVALIQLLTPLTGIPTIKVAGPSERGSWSAGTQATIIGWGVTESGSTTDRLRQAQVPIVNDAACANAYGSSFDAVTMVCAGYLGVGGVDTCQGDSGGPLLVPAGGGWRQAGITSWGQGCAEPDFPGVYSRVADDTLRAFVAANVPGAIGS